MITYLWVTMGSALGGLLRYSIARAILSSSAAFPWGTVLINVLGCFVIGFFGTATLSNSRFAASDNIRLFVMVGICGGFTTFSSFSLESFELLRTGAWGKAATNILLSVVLCLFSVAVGHLLAQRWTQPGTHGTAIAQTAEEEFTG